MVPYQGFANTALRDELLSRSECQAVLNTPDDELLALLQAAFTVRSRYFGKTVRLQMLLNAKSGACQEDCHYCSQSAVSKKDDRSGTPSRHFESSAVLHCHQWKEPVGP